MPLCVQLVWENKLFKCFWAQSSKIIGKIYFLCLILAVAEIDKHMKMEENEKEKILQVFINNYYAEELAIRFKILNLNTEVLIYGMSSRSLHTVRSFWVNNCYCIVVISIFLHKFIPSNELRNISCIGSFISVVEELACESTQQGKRNAESQVFANFSKVKQTYEVVGCINTAVKLQISEDPHHIFHILQKRRTIA